MQQVSAGSAIMLTGGQSAAGENLSLGYSLGGLLGMPPLVTLQSGLGNLQAPNYTNEDKKKILMHDDGKHTHYSVALDAFCSSRLTDSAVLLKRLIIKILFI